MGLKAEMTLINVTVNGQTREIPTDPTRSLLDVLREDLDLTGAKLACDTGECGSCIVLLGKKGVMSCLLPISRVGDKPVTTIEGLYPARFQEIESTSAALDDLHPLQQAFVELGASQCGFCIPGIIMEAQALLFSNPNPTRKDIVTRLSRNMCRCTGYIKIIDAILYAAALLRGEARQAPPTNGYDHIVGSPVLQLDALSEVTGKANYAADLKMPGMLIAKILRSPYHHAIIRSIDISEAEATLGVEAVITAKEVPGPDAMLASRPQPYFLARDKVRFLGEAVAAVAAVSEEVAAEAIDRIKVEYEPLPAIFDPVEAMKEDAPRLYPPYDNYVRGGDVIRGDVEKVFAEADVVVESTFDTPPWEHAAMEPEAGLAYVDDTGQVVIHTPLHHPFAAQIWVAALVGLDKGQVRIICPAMGGNFGMRGDFLHVGVLALFVLKTRKPVKMVFTREESMLGSAKAASFHLRYKTGATKDGKLVALEAEIIQDGGCWVPIPELTGKPVRGGKDSSSPGPYYYPNARIKNFQVCTNRPRSIPMRGSSIPQMALAWETQMDLLAKKLGMDPLGFRIVNALTPGCQSVTGQILEESVGARTTLEALRGPYAEALARKASEPLPYPWKRGIGVACIWQGGADRSGQAGGGWHGIKLGPARAGLELMEDGRVRVITGLVEKGQGVLTAMAQVAAEDLGLSLESVVMVYGDTLLGPYPIGSSGQRTGFQAGGAILRACGALKEALVQLAARVLERPPEELVVQGGFVYSSRFPQERLSFKQLADLLSDEGLPTKYEGAFTFEKSDRRPGPVTEVTEGGSDVASSSNRDGPVSSYASQLTELDVNVETGKVKVLRVVYSADVGRVLNIQSFEGQVEGGVIMGLSYALKERFVPGVTKTLKDYNLPTIQDAPEEVKTIIVENPLSYGPFGAKGGAEMTVCPGVPSIINAIDDAIGVRIYRLPASPERILEALGRKQ